MLLCGINVAAEETILLGNVHNAGTGEAVENASVYFRGTKVGTTTDADGFFYLRVDVLESVKLVVSAIGYKKQVFNITPGESAGIEVLLEERTDMLQEVVAVSSEDPAMILMSRVRNARKTNGATDAVGTVGKARTYYFISDIRPRQLKYKLWRDLQSGMIPQSDSSFLLPLTDDVFPELAVPLPERFDFYKPTIPFHTVSFLSPLAAGSSMFYRFYLLDSLVVRYGAGQITEKHYRVRFLPRNRFDPVFEGVLEVDSATAALRRVDAYVPRDVNINYVNALHYNALYSGNNTLLDERLAVLMETEIKADTTKLFPSLYAVRDMHSEFELTPDTLLTVDSVVTSFIESVRPSPLPALPSDTVMHTATDSLTQLPLYRFARWAAEICHTGYIPTGTAVNIGQLTDVIGYTRHEHLCLGLPFKTSQLLSRRVSLGAWVGYGFRDRGVKYKVSAEFLLPTEYRHMITMTVKDRYEATDVKTFDALQRENSWTESNLNFTSYIFRNLYYNNVTAINTAARKREVSVIFEDEWQGGRGKSPAVETTFSVAFGRQSYGMPEEYHYYDMPSFAYASASGIVRLGWGGRTADFFTVRKHAHSDLPVLFLGAELGSWRLDEQSYGLTTSVSDNSSYHIYGNLNLMLQHEVPLGVAGRLSYIFKAGLVIGKVPYPFLAFMNGNQGYTYQPERFTLMNNMQYAADKYMLLHVNWDGRGIVFGRVPGVRYARLHELAEFKLAYGGLSEKQRNLNRQYLSDVNSLNIPYAEVGVGLGNILRVGEVWAVWRLTHRNDLSAAWWGIRFRLHLGL